MLRILIFGILILIGIFSVHESYSQYMGTPSSDIWYDAVDLLTQEYVDENQLRNESIFEDSIKIRIIGGLADVLPPNYHVRIMYDMSLNKEIQHMDSVYKVDFGPLARTPEKAKLVKLFEMEYKPPKKSPDYFEVEKNTKIYRLYLNIMCRQGFESVVKESTNEEVCLKIESVGHLVDRGWIKIDHSTSRILKIQNYDSLRVPISVTHKKLDVIYPDYNYISVAIWNLRNITMNYSVEAFDPYGEKVKNCPSKGVRNPHEAHSRDEWKILLHTCGPTKFGNYTVIVFSDAINEIFFVYVTER